MAKQRFLGLLLALLWAGLLGGCGGEGGGVSLTQDSLAEWELGEEEDALAEVAEPTGPASWLEFFDASGDDGNACQGFSAGGAGVKNLHCEFRLKPGQRREFKLLYLEDGVGVAGRKLGFQLQTQGALPAGSLAALETAGVLSGPGGLGSFAVTSKGTEGRFLVKADAKDLSLPGAGALFFHVEVVRPPEVVELAFEYGGQQRPESLELGLFLSELPGRCAALDPRDPPKASTELLVAGLGATATVKTSKVLGGLPEAQLAVLVRGFGPEVSGLRPLLVTGCLEAGLLRAGEALSVTVPVGDLVPLYAGRYRVLSHLDFLSALPPQAQGVLDSVLGLLESPGAGLLTLACLQGEGSGLLGTACGLLFVEALAPTPEGLTVLGRLAAEAVDQAFQELLQQQGLAGAWDLGADFSHLLQSVELEGVLEIAAEPDAGGAIPASATALSLELVRLDWSFGQDCQGQGEGCGLVELDLASSGQGGLVSGSFEARVPGFSAGQQDQLEILPFSAKFRYGAFLAFLVDELLLPAVGGPEVQGFEGLLGQLVGGLDCGTTAQCCQGFGGLLGYSPGDFLSGILAQGCRVMLPLAAGYLEGALEGLALEGDGLWLATPPERPCGLHFEARLKRLESLAGTSGDPDACHWLMGLGAAGKELRFDGDFVGNRIP